MAVAVAADMVAAAEEADTPAAVDTPADMAADTQRLMRAVTLILNITARRRPVHRARPRRI